MATLHLSDGRAISASGEIQQAAGLLGGEAGPIPDSLVLVARDDGTSVYINPRQVVSIEPETPRGFAYGSTRPA